MCDDPAYELLLFGIQETTTLEENTERLRDVHLRLHDPGKEDEAAVIDQRPGGDCPTDRLVDLFDPHSSELDPRLSRQLVARQGRMTGLHCFLQSVYNARGDSGRIVERHAHVARDLISPLETDPGNLDKTVWVMQHDILSLARLAEYLLDAPCEAVGHARTHQIHRQFLSTAIESVSLRPLAPRLEHLLPDLPRKELAHPLPLIGQDLEAIQPEMINDLCRPAGAAEPDVRGDVCHDRCFRGR